MTLSALLSLLIAGFTKALLEVIKDAIMQSLNKPDIVVSPTLPAPLPSPTLHTGPDILGKWGRV